MFFSAQSNIGCREDESSNTSTWTTALNVAREISSKTDESCTDRRNFLQTAKVKEIINDSVRAEQNESKSKINGTLTRWIKLDEIVLSEFIEILISHDVSPLALFMTNSYIDFDKICDFITQRSNSFDGGACTFVAQFITHECYAHQLEILVCYTNFTGIGTKLYSSLTELINPSILIALLNKMLKESLENQEVKHGGAYNFLVLP